MAMAERDETSGMLSTADRSPAAIRQRLQLLKQAEDQWRATRQDIDLARTLSEESFTEAFPLNDGAVALKRLPELVSLAATIADVSPAAAGDARKTAAFVYAKQAMYPEALQQYNEALHLFEMTDDSFNRVTVLENRAKVERIQGRPELALADIETALPLVQSNGDKLGELALEVERGATASAYGQLGVAYEADMHAITLAEATPDPFLSGLAWSDLGVAYTELRDFPKAASALDRADAIWKNSGNVFGQLQTTEDRAELRLAEGALDQARALFAAGAEASKSTPREHTYFLRGLAVAEMRAGRYADTETHLKQANAEAQSQQVNDTLSQIDASLADLKAQQGKWEEASALWKQAESVAKQQRNHLNRALALGGLVRAQVHAGDPALASNTCADAMNELELVRGQVPEAALRLSFFSSRHALYELCVGTALRRGDQETAFNTAERSRARALLDQATAAGMQIKEATAKPAELATAQTITQRELIHSLDAHTAVLVYWHGKDRSCVWRVTARGASLYTLPPAAALDQQIKHYLRILLAPIHSGPSASAVERKRSLDTAAAAAMQQGMTLRRVLLPMRFSTSIRRILLVKDGATLSLSFGTLPVSSTEYLGERYVLVTEPSASFATHLGHAVPFSHARAIVFADPLALDSGTASLPFSRQEERTVIEAFGRARTTVLDGPQASRSNALKLDWGNYGVAHFATHAVIRNARPELSGLALASEESIPEHTAMATKTSLLSYFDILKIRAPLQLVVLSSCSSAEGKFLPGEGKLALDNAFLGAGAARVLATLWPVDDEATSVFMQKFYRSLTKTHSPAESLHEAEREMARSKAWGAPYYWGAFTLSGQWTPFSD